MAEQIKNLSWFPGHMKKAANELANTLSRVDLVIEVGDARAPYSSLNSYLDKMIQGKKKIIVYSKKDLADPQRTRLALDTFKKEGIDSFVLDFKNREDISFLLHYLSGIKSTKALKYERYGLATPPLRAMVIGIPNVGKSTLINSLVGKKKAAVANKPGETKVQTLIKVSERLELYDTPGILQPNYDDKNALRHLAWLGSLNDQAIPIQDIMLSLTDFLLKNYKESLYSYYKIPLSRELNKETFLYAVAEERKFLLSGGDLDLNRAGEAFLKEFRAGQIVKCVVDDVKA